MFPIGTESHASSASLADAVGHMLGDFTPSQSAAPPEDGSQAEGAPPTTEPAPGSDGVGEASAEGATDQPGQAEAQDSDGQRAAAPDDTEQGTDAQDADFSWFDQDAKPLTYTVDGQSRTYDRLKVLDDGTDPIGLIRGKDAIQDITRRLGERDHLYETNQRQHHDLSRLERLSAWQTQGTDGRTLELTGAEGLTELRVAYGKALAENEAIVRALTDPAWLTNAIGVSEDGQVSLRQDALNYLLAQVEAGQLKTEKGIRDAIGRMVQAERQEPVHTDYAAQAPAMFQSVCQTAGVDPQIFTDADRAFLQEQLVSAGYIRPATPDELRMNPAWKPGQQVIAPSFLTLVKRESERVQQAKSGAEVAQKAARENAARLKATRPQPKSAAPVTTPTTPTDPAASRKDAADSAWDLMHRQQTDALKARHRVAG